MVSVGCVVLMIKISMSGGFGGLATAPGKTAVLDDVQARQSAVVCEAFDPKALEALEGRFPPAGRADTIVYDITVTDEAGAHRFRFDETQLPADMLDLIDDIMHGQK
ncbi:hypothetical protein LA6_000101 [Marinibacterium anthonyi]|nr:hypothetical protein LA6_000101 [Marinibacterium anthonyi]